MTAIDLVRLLVLISCVTAAGIAGWRSGEAGEGYPWELIGLLVATEAFLGWVIQ